MLPKGLQSLVGTVLCDGNADTVHQHSRCIICHSRNERYRYGRKRRNDVLDNGRDIGDNILERFHHVIDELLHIGVGSAEARYEVLYLFGLLLIKIIGGLRSSEMDYIFAHCDKFYALPPAKDQAESEA